LAQRCWWSYLLLWHVLIADRLALAVMGYAALSRQIARPKGKTLMCSNCRGQYENPDMTSPDEADIIEADDYPLLPETMEREFAPRACLMDGSDCGSSLCPPAPDSAMLAVRSYLSAVKRFGLALEQLGRPCDKP